MMIEVNVNRGVGTEGEASLRRCPCHSSPTLRYLRPYTPRLTARLRRAYGVKRL